MTEKSVSLSADNLLNKEMLSSYAYDAVRSAILTGWIPQGTQLIVRKLSQSLDFSPTPIKQALAALEKEGLIVSIPYRGFFVPDLSSHDVMEVFTVRESLEVTAVKLIVEQANPEAVVELEHILSLQEADIVQDSGSISTTIDLDIAFHNKLAELSANQRLKDFVANLLGPVRLIMARSYSPQRRVVIAESEYREHKLIVDAIKAGDIHSAMQVVEKHCRDTCMSHLRYFHTLPLTEPVTERANDEVIKTPDLDIDFSIISEAVYEVLRVNLVDCLGPLASIVCKDIVAKSSSLEEAISELKQQIPNQDQANSFEVTVREMLKGSLSHDATTGSGNN